MNKSSNYVGMNNFPPDDDPFGVNSKYEVTSACCQKFCAVIVGLADPDMRIFLKCFRETISDWRFYIRRDYYDGVLIAHDCVEWDTGNVAIQSMIDFLHFLADAGRPVMFIRWGDDFEAWANDKGHRTFRNRITRKDGYGVEFAPDDI